ncbi:MAG: hypothetical protein AAF481_03455 [Acidobacteriota bacterium]
MSYPFQPNPPIDEAPASAPPPLPPDPPPGRRRDWIVVDLVDRLNRSLYTATEPWPEPLQDELGRPLRQAAAAAGVVVSGCFRTHSARRRSRFEEIGRRLLRRIGRTVATAQREGLLTPDVALHLFGLQSAVALGLGSAPAPGEHRLPRSATGASSEPDGAPPPPPADPRRAVQVA